MKSKLSNKGAKFVLLVALTLQISACAKKQFGSDYEELVTSSKSKLQSAQSSDEFESSQYSVDKTYQLLKQKAAIQNNDICQYFKTMSTEDIYFFYPEFEKDTALECHKELIDHVKSLVSKQMEQSLDQNVEIAPSPSDDSLTKLEGSILQNEALPSPQVPSPKVPVSSQASAPSQPSSSAQPQAKSQTPAPTPKPTASAAPRPIANPVAAQSLRNQPPQNQSAQTNSVSTRAANTIGLGTHSTTGEKLIKILSPMGKPHLFGGLGKKQIALTFDDGPHGHLSSLLMQTLKKQGVYATFFLVGKNTLAYKNLVKQEWASGHSVGGHSLTHANLAGLSYNSATYEIRGSMNNIVSVLGFTPNLFRFPYGARTSALSAYLAQQKIAEVAWNMDSLDWKYRNPQVLYNYAIQQVKNTQGGIILFHDIQPHTIAMMPTFLQWLRNNGYKTYLLKGNQLLKPTQVVPKP